MVEGDVIMKEFRVVPESLLQELASGVDMRDYKEAAFKLLDRVHKLRAWLSENSEEEETKNNLIDNLPCK